MKRLNTVVYISYQNSEIGTLLSKTLCTAEFRNSNFQFRNIFKNKIPEFRNSGISETTLNYRPYVYDRTGTVYSIRRVGFRNSGFRNYRKVFGQNFPESKIYFPETYRKRFFTT